MATAWGVQELVAEAYDAGAPLVAEAGDAVAPLEVAVLRRLRAAMLRHYLLRGVH